MDRSNRILSHINDTRTGMLNVLWSFILAKLNTLTANTFFVSSIGFSWYGWFVCWEFIYWEFHNLRFIIYNYSLAKLARGKQLAVIPCILYLSQNVLFYFTNRQYTFHFPFHNIFTLHFRNAVCAFIIKYFDLPSGISFCTGFELCMYS